MKPIQWSLQAHEMIASRIPPPEETLPVALGIVAFGSALAASTWTQKFVGVSTGSLPPIPTVTGVVTVCAAACLSHKVALFTQSKCRRPNRPWRQSIPVDTSSTVVSLGSFKVTAQMIRVCFVGMLAFRVLGGRFWSVAPSSYTHIGSFARGNLLGGSLPATANYATPLQREKIERMGRLFGCHTCGSRRLLQIVRHQFVGDHMPPKAVAEQMNRSFWRRVTGRKVSYRFYPQCVLCSSRQGSLLSQATQRLKTRYSPRIRLAGVGGGQQAHFHGLRPRWSHLAGGVVAGAAIIDPDLKPIEQWSRRAGEKVETFLRKNFPKKR